ncbi:hypothetical protein GOODEAATRI_025892 [Goodea atripinnis]|uniref:Uncharacterized protein n=1 Tax=Goodea atripinnis TaxID=208336 RepID=A0ABV0PRP1_9TELE
MGGCHCDDNGTTTGIEVVLLIVTECTGVSGSNTYGFLVFCTYIRPSPVSNSWSRVLLSLGSKRKTVSDKFISATVFCTLAPLERTTEPRRRWEDQGLCKTNKNETEMVTACVFLHATLRTGKQDTPSHYYHPVEYSGTTP